MRINKFLAKCGLGSRRKVEELILSGKIKVNHEIITDLGRDINLEVDKVYFEEKELKVVDEQLYYMLNKPKDYICSKTDKFNRKPVLTLIKDNTNTLFTVGRLDYKTEGLLLITNDGEWANNIIHPKSQIRKKYEVEILGKLNNINKEKIEKGIVIDGKKTLPAKIEVLSVLNDKTKLYITIYEGRNREIRKLFEYVGNKVTYLKRLSIGKLELGKLKLGEYRQLTKEEKIMVFIKE